VRDKLKALEDKLLSQVSWHILVISALWTPMGNDHELEAMWPELHSKTLSQEKKIDKMTVIKLRTCSS
jgi:hypothetical protein